MKVVVTRIINSRNADNIKDVAKLPTVASAPGSGLTTNFIEDEHVEAFVTLAVLNGKVAHVFDYADTFAPQTTITSSKAA